MNADLTAIARDRFKKELKANVEKAIEDTFYAFDDEQLSCIVPSAVVRFRRPSDDIAPGELCPRCYETKRECECPIEYTFGVARMVWHKPDYLTGKHVVFEPFEMHGCPDFTEEIWANVEDAIDNALGEELPVPPPVF